MADTIELKMENFVPPKFRCVTCDNDMSESRAFRFPICDEAWNPIMPRGEVYSTQFTERGWMSFSDLHKL